MRDQPREGSDVDLFFDHPVGSLGLFELIDIEDAAARILGRNALEGSVVTGVNGEKPVTLTAGQTFYEGPSDIHTVGRNASKTMPAKFLVFFLKDKDAPILIPVN